MGGKKLNSCLVFHCVLVVCLYLAINCKSITQIFTWLFQRLLWTAGNATCTDGARVNVQVRSLRKTKDKSLTTLINLGNNFKAHLGTRVLLVMDLFLAMPCSVHLKVPLDVYYK